MTTPYLANATLPPPCLGDTIARMQVQIDSQAEQLRILGELVEALRGEVEAMRQDAATRTQSDQDDMVAK